MATAYIYSAYGYDNHDGELGHSESYAGREWWLPLGRVTPIPNFTLRELDHDRSTPTTGEVAVAQYLTVIVSGGRIAQELCEKQVPVANALKGIMIIEGKPTGRTVEVFAGWDSEGGRITVEVPEREATKSEVAEAERRCKSYKEAVVSEYLISRRERNNGGRGPKAPSPIVRAFMDELGVEDVDDVTAHAKAGGIPLELIKMILDSKVTSKEDLTKMLNEAVETVRKAGKAQVAPTKLSGNRYSSPSLDLAANKAKYYAEHPEEAELLGIKAETEPSKE